MNFPIDDIGQVRARAPDEGGSLREVENFDAFNRAAFIGAVGRIIAPVYLSNGLCAGN